jgi:hypothetical protein
MPLGLLGGTALAIGTFAVSATAYGSRRSNNFPPIQKGWYVGLDFGPSWDVFDAAGPDHHLRYRKIGLNLDVRVGYAVSNHLALGVFYSGSSSGTVHHYGCDYRYGYPGYRGRYYWINGRRVPYRWRYRSDCEPEFKTGLFGMDFAWRFDDEVFVGIGAGLAHMRLTSRAGTQYSDDGWGVQGRIGKEWRLRDGPLIGVVVGIDYLKSRGSSLMSYRDSSDNYRTIEYDTARAVTTFVAVSITFN